MGPMHSQSKLQTNTRGKGDEHMRRDTNHAHTHTDTIPTPKANSGVIYRRDQLSPTRKLQKQNHTRTPQTPHVGVDSGSTHRRANSVSHAKLQNTKFYSNFRLTCCRPRKEQSVVVGHCGGRRRWARPVVRAEGARLNFAKNCDSACGREERERERRERESGA